jgi:hypothetical protein
LLYHVWNSSKDSMPSWFRSASTKACSAVTCASFSGPTPRRSLVPGCDSYRTAKQNGGETGRGQGGKGGVRRRQTVDGIADGTRQSKSAYTHL